MSPLVVVVPIFLGALTLLAVGLLGWASSSFEHEHQDDGPGGHVEVSSEWWPS